MPFRKPSCALHMATHAHRMAGSPQNRTPSLPSLLWPNGTGRIWFPECGYMLSTCVLRIWGKTGHPQICDIIVQVRDLDKTLSIDMNWMSRVCILRNADAALSAMGRAGFMVKCASNTPDGTIEAPLCMSELKQDHALTSSCSTLAGILWTFGLYTDQIPDSRHSDATRLPCPGDVR